MYLHVCENEKEKRDEQKMLNAIILIPVDFREEVPNIIFHHIHRLLFLIRALNFPSGTTEKTPVGQQFKGKKNQTFQTTIIKKYKE